MYPQLKELKKLQKYKIYNEKLLVLLLSSYKVNDKKVQLRYIINFPEKLIERATKKSTKN